MCMRYTQGQNEEYLLSRSIKQVPHNMHVRMHTTMENTFSSVCI